MRLASRVAINRTVAGVHFPVDSAAGQLLGLTLGEYFVHLATAAAGTNFRGWQFDGTKFLKDADFEWRLIYTPGGAGHVTPTSGPNYAPQLPAGGAAVIAPSGYLPWLWAKAKGEWT
jgi:hypothetical protein